MRKLHKKEGIFYFPSFWVLEMLMQEFLIGILKCFRVIVLNIAVKSCQILDNVAAVINFTSDVGCINVGFLADENYMSRTVFDSGIVQAENTIILIVSFFLEFIGSCGNENGKIFILKEQRCIFLVLKTQFIINQALFFFLLCFCYS